MYKNPVDEIIEMLDETFPDLTVGPGADDYSFAMSYGGEFSVYVYLDISNMVWRAELVSVNGGEADIRLRGFNTWHKDISAMVLEHTGWSLEVAK